MVPSWGAMITPVYALRIASPLLVLVTTTSLLSARPQSRTSSSPITSVVVASKVPRRAPILVFLSLSALTYFADGIAFVVKAVLTEHWKYDTGIEINAIAGLLAFAGLAVLGSWKDVQGVDVWSYTRTRLAIAAALGLDIALVVLLGLAIPTLRTDPIHVPIFKLLHFIFPALRLLVLLPLLIAVLFPRTVYGPADEYPEEEQTPTDSSFLLPPGTLPQSSSGLSPVPGLNEQAKYGTFRPTARSTLQRSAPTTRAPTPAPSNAPDSKADDKRDLVLDPSWAEIGRRIRRLTPYLWPSKDRYLQLLASLCVIILLIGRVVNFAMPFVLAKVVRLLAKPTGQSPWPWLFAYVGLRFLQGSGGLSAVRDALWAPVMQYSDRQMSQLSFDHILNLSFAWHTRRKTGEVLRVLDRGAAINHTFELILFNIIPTFIDIVVALATFCYVFEWSLGLVIFVVMFAYLTASVLLTQWRTQLRRRMVERDTVTRGIHTDCLLNYETVKYFGGEEHEGERYREALQEYQSLEYRVIIALNILNMVQNLIITLGLLVGSMIVALRVTKGLSDAAEFILFITYLAQLYGPLNQLGYIYRSINQSLVDTEKLLALLNEPTEVNDSPGAPDLLVSDGAIEFDNVSFSYDGRTTALNGVSFKVAKGHSVALVGESGSGKSTILRLLYRFYDLNPGEGRILVDGQDIREVTQKSLRQAIGVVPQDSVLFNKSVKYNIGYGKFGASLEEIETAARSAQMHDKIMSFPDGYDTKVGERGVRLSGGEKQRVAIARTLLKNPPILLLDEATSALDTSTEKDIQKALQNLMNGRSSLSIAHRLSTIASADLILVLKDGQIVEHGNHKELLAKDGIFAAMWAEQVSSDDRTSINENESIQKKEVSGYAVEESGSHGPENGHAAADATTDATSDATAASQPQPGVSYADVVKDGSSTEDQAEAEAPATTSKDLPEIPDSAPIAFPSSGDDDRSAEGTSEPAVATPANVTSTQQTAEPLAFPSSDGPDSTPERAETPSQAPGVTFGAIDTPQRVGTPDPDSEPKRKRISSQNFQRLARRISISTRRQNSGSGFSFPGLKKDKDSPRTSVDAGGTDSAATSIKGDADKGKSKKDKKDKDKKGSA